MVKVWGLRRGEQVLGVNMLVAMIAQYSALKYLLQRRLLVGLLHHSLLNALLL